MSKAAALGKLGQFDEALIVCEDLLTLLGDRQNDELRIELAFALNGRAIWLKALDRDDEARTAYQLVLDKYGRGEDPEIDSVIENAQTQLRLLTS